jgi:NTP pyrophosphatase (non-canonical NTP hydrolase)
MNINEFAKEVHENAVEHGWWEKERGFAEVIALCHSELSEALEEYRNNRPQLYYNCEYQDTRSKCPDKYDACQYGKNEGCNKAKPEGIAVELADCIIRILDYCGKENIDIEEVLRIKHEYNKTRPYKHGGKTI